VEAVTDNDKHIGSYNQTWTAVFSLVGLLLLAGGYGYYRGEAERIRHEKYHDIATINALKVNQIQQWRQERLADARKVAESPFFRRALEAWRNNPDTPSLLADWQKRLRLEQKDNTYANVLLLDPDGSLLLAAQAVADPIPPATRQAIGVALADREILLSDCYRAPDHRVYLDTVAPVVTAEGQPQAVLVLRSSLESSLYPLIQSWPTDSPSAEALLIQREGDEVVFLNEWRHPASSTLFQGIPLAEMFMAQSQEDEVGSPNESRRPASTALSRRFPLAHSDHLPAAQAILGREGPFQGRDYRGVEVVADLRPIARSPWFLVVKVDADEILAEGRYRAAMVALFVLLGILLTAAAVAIAYRQRQARLYRDLYCAEREQRLAQEEFRITLYSLGEAVITTDPEGQIRHMNPAAAQLTGWLEAEARGRRLDEVCQIVNEETHIVIEDPLQRVLQEGRVVGLASPTWLIARDGTERPIAASGAPLHDGYGARTGVVLVFRDLTQERQAVRKRDALEAQLHQAQKMDAIGQLAGGIAHDFNNMLAVITGHAEMALEQTEPDGALYANLLEIRKAAQRSANLTHQLLAFARKQTIAPRVLDLNDTIASMLKMLGRLIGEDINLVWKPAGEPALVKMDPAQIDQILANLVVNARDAIAGVGQIIIETGPVTLDEAYCERHAGCHPGSYILLTVSDDGGGMDQGVLARLFEPFFTTKPQGQGTGLGLATVYGIVKQNHGFINVSSDPGEGTVFKIYLPRHTSDQADTAVGQAPTEAPTGTETVLLVEDETALLELSTQLLEQLGYAVLAAGHPNQALELAERHIGPIHLLLTDVIMPEMSGPDLWQRLSALKPSLKCLFMSGYTADVIARHGVLGDGVHLLQKPFSREVLATKLREALAAP